MSPGPQGLVWRQRLKRSFLSGLLVVIPLVATIWVLQFLFTLADNLLQPLLTHHLQTHIPGLGILTTVLAILLVGSVTRSLLAQRTIRLGEHILQQIPLAGAIYGAVKQILSAITREGGDHPKKVVLVPWPSPGLWAVGFLNGEITVGVDERYGLVLILNSINPATGFLTLVPLNRLRRLDLSVEAAMKLVISGGIAGQPDLPLLPAETDPAEADRP